MFLNDRLVTIEACSLPALLLGYYMDDVSPEYAKVYSVLVYN